MVLSQDGCGDAEKNIPQFDLAADQNYFFELRDLAFIRFSSSAVTTSKLLGETHPFDPL
jgi:hypothetical protein